MRRTSRKFFRLTLTNLTMNREFLSLIIIVILSIAVSLLPIDVTPKGLIMIPLIIIGLAVLALLHKRHTYLFIAVFVSCCPMVAIGIVTLFSRGEALSLLTMANCTIILWMTGAWLLSKGAPQHIFENRKLLIGTGLLGVFMTTAELYMLSRESITTSSTVLMVLLGTGLCVLIFITVVIRALYTNHQHRWWQQCCEFAEGTVNVLYNAPNESLAHEICLALWNNRSLSTGPHMINITTLYGNPVAVFMDSVRAIYQLVYSAKMPRVGIIPSQERVFLEEKLLEFFRRASALELMSLPRYARDHSYGYPTGQSEIWIPKLAIIRNAARTYGPEVVWDYFVIELLALTKEFRNYNPDNLWHAYKNLLYRLEDIERTE